MILIDALYINNSGGKILLDFLIQKLEESSKEVYYLLDARVENHIPEIKESNTVLFMKASLFLRKAFYKKHSDSFSTVFCFGNLPPNIKLQAKVYTYFHQQLYIRLPETVGLKQRISFFLKRKVFRSFVKNSDYWLLQTHLIKTNFESKFNIDPAKVLVLPFYPKAESQEVFIRKRYSYLYVSNATVHKNHIRLINAFCNFYTEHKLGTLTLTIGDDYPELLDLIKDKQLKKFPIRNIGFVKREELIRIYKESEYLIFPSLAESFGLGLLEAIENGCKIIGADLPYTYAVCKPSLTFNPLHEKSISNALSLSLQNNVENSIAKVSNQIDEIIYLLM